MDTLTSALRSANMRAVKGKNTAPEMTVRRILSGAGYRYRLHVKSLPGCPDFVFVRSHRIIFVHGCFWHRHSAKGCKRGTLPSSNVAFWKSKLAKNVKRDAAHKARLEAEGWRVLVVWECETRQKGLAGRIRRFLGKPNKRALRVSN